jgi:hypothetical protein
MRDTMPTKIEIQEFSDNIIQLAEMSGEGIMDTIVSYCERTGLEIDIASTLISSSLKSKIREEAQNLNLLKKSAKLPV